MKRNNLKSLLAAYRMTNANFADVLHDAADVSDDMMVTRILKAIVLDMRAEDEAAAKSAQKAAEVSGPPAP